ncbi:hypothetical protein [Oceaniglobus ichthyenteri]|uniref:hypothetical protein n=1 Tax=Oceaniglobus ichthyenteri TaxID=2136177 RepID=UPI000D33EF21|nr:hypothetical protein [Oceaniglobus ichthyenteri]
MLKPILLSLCLALTLPGMARAQDGDAAALLSTQVGQAFGIPMINGRLLTSTITGKSQEHLKRNQRQPDELANALAKGWGLFGQMQMYRGAENPDNGSLELARYVLDTQGRMYFLTQMGVANMAPAESAESFERWMKQQADEFHRAAFYKNMKAIYGAGGPVVGEILVEMHTSVSFGEINPTTGALQIRNIAPAFQRIGYLHNLGSFQYKMDDIEQKTHLNLPPANAVDIVRAMTRSKYGDTREAYLVIRGTLSLSGTAREANIWTPQEVVLYLDPLLQRPLPGFGLSDFYLDLGIARRAAEKAAVEAAEAAARRAAEAALTVATNEEKRRYELQQAFQARSLDILGLTLGQNEDAARALLADRYQLSTTQATPAHDLTTCGVLFTRLERDLRAQTSTLSQNAGRSDGTLTPEDAELIATRRAERLANMPPECQIDTDPLSQSFTANRAHGGGITDEIRVYLGKNAPRDGQVIAVARVLNWNGATVDVIAQMEQKYGAAGAFAPSDTQRFWVDDIDAFLRMEQDRDFAETCVPLRLWQQSGSVLPAANVARACGAYIGLAAGRDRAEIQLVDATFISDAAKTAQAAVEAAKAAPAVEIEF